MLNNVIYNHVKKYMGLSISAASKVDIYPKSWVCCVGAVLKLKRLQICTSRYGNTKYKITRVNLWH